MPACVILMQPARNRLTASTLERVHVHLVVSHQLVGAAAGDLAVQGGAVVVGGAAPVDGDLVVGVVVHVFGIEMENALRRVMDAEGRLTRHNILAQVEMNAHTARDFIVLSEPELSHEGDFVDVAVVGESFALVGACFDHHPGAG
jgi:hypothetical protein